MSVMTSGMPNRSAKARAFGRSLSKIAAASAPRVLARTGRCASCAIAPAPITRCELYRSCEILHVFRESDLVRGSRSHLRECLRRWSDGGSRVIGVQNRAKVLASPGSPNCAGLAHPYAMPIAESAQREDGDRSVGRRALLD